MIGYGYITSTKWLATTEDSVYAWVLPGVAKGADWFRDTRPEHCDIQSHPRNPSSRQPLLSIKATARSAQHRSYSAYSGDSAGKAMVSNSGTPVRNGASQDGAQAGRRKL